MSDLYDILDPWGFSDNSNSAATGAGSTGSGYSDSTRSCLDRVILPPIYTIAYSAAIKAGSGSITRDVLQRVLAYSDLPRHIIGQIILAADTGAPMISQQDFNLALAMAALAQKNMPPSIDTVLFHRDDLPVPEIDGIEALLTDADMEIPRQSISSPAFADTSDDPWLSAAAKGADMPVASATAAMGAVSVSADGVVSGSAPPADLTNGNAGKGQQNQGVVAAAENRSSISGGGGVSSQTFVPQISMDTTQWKLDVEDVSIKESAERGGIVFKHTNYEVTTRSFTAMVVRRYNDFFWISNYLVRRYPYRMHPNIPPKGFPDNRVKGLTRFSSAILRIPFLRRDALVIQFFSNTDEFARVVKVGNLDMDAEEFDPNEEAGNTPWAEIQQTYMAFDDFYGQVSRDEEKYRVQITALEKIARYTQAIGDELYAYSDTLRTLNMPTESATGSRKFYMLSKAKRALNGNLNELSMSFGDASLLDKSQGEVMKTMSAEYLRRLYDVVIAMKLMMDRIRQMDKGKEILRVRERIDANRKALGLLSGESATSVSSTAASGPVDRSGMERLEKLIGEDTADLNKLELEQQCIELRFYQELARYKCYESFLHTHYHRFVEERIKHHTLALNAWKQALVTADDLPTNPLDFIS
ncbi:Sorting nexin mvp1 [Kickxella alabastrina]|uniref:Sorting nexin mvp1 n=1 Tax=Kickxella alabastrina TaxID=61397 RepID=A0ACC1IRN4_9FUNG|nr:Sorting nexin mvp1 [Kickxella alabastrina]